jgi:hypothetical protein
MYPITSFGMLKYTFRSTIYLKASLTFKLAERLVHQSMHQISMFLFFLQKDMSKQKRYMFLPTPAMPCTAHPGDPALAQGARNSAFGAQVSFSR